MSIKKIVMPNKSVRWEVYSKLPIQNGKRIRRRFEKRIEAEEFLLSFKSRKKGIDVNSRDTILDIEGRTFSEEADYWLLKKGHEFTPGYFRVIKPGLNKIKKFLGNYKISKFNPSLLVEFRLLLKSEGLSNATQNRYIDLISRIINFSYKQQRINNNPSLGYEKVKENEVEMLFWDEFEVKRFLSASNLKYPLGSKKRWIYCAYLMALETGMRAREIWGLKVGDIPVDGNKLRVSRQLIKGNVFVLTKGRDSRFVPFSETLKAEALGLIKNSDSSNKETTLFKTSTSTAVDHDNFSDRIFKKDVLEFGLRKIRFHDLRHTALTLMVKRGILLPMIQKIAGHKDFKTTMRYVHVLGKDIDEIGGQFSLGNHTKVAGKLSVVKS